jgi:Ca2+-binding RTX toxin-like protein
MTIRRIRALTLVFLAALILVSVFTALAAANSVPDVRLADKRFATSISDFTPPDCVGLNLTNITSASGLTFGTDQGDLILGSASGEIILGLGGDDCILGGVGNDTLVGFAGTDVCIGGPGTDTFQFLFWVGCETEIQ